MSLRSIWGQFEPNVGVNVGVNQGVKDKDKDKDIDKVIINIYYICVFLKKNNHEL